MPDLPRFQAQMMLFAGIFLLGWVMIRLHLRSRGSRAASDRRMNGLRAPAPARGAPLVDAPPSVLRWQAAMLDLQRDLTAELDTRIAVAQSLLRQADEKLAALDQALAAPPAEDARRPDVPHPASPRLPEIRRLAQRGFTAEEIGQQLGLATGDVELLLQFR